MTDLPLFDHASRHALDGALRIMDTVTMGLMLYAERRARCAWHGVTQQRHRDHVRATADRMKFELETIKP